MVMIDTDWSGSLNTLYLKNEGSAKANTRGNATVTIRGIALFNCIGSMSAGFKLVKLPAQYEN
jgi:hypothetical protein